MLAMGSRLPAMPTPSCSLHVTPRLGLDGPLYPGSGQGASESIENTGVWGGAPALISGPFPFCLYLTLRKAGQAGLGLSVGTIVLPFSGDRFTED